MTNRDVFTPKKSRSGCWVQIFGEYLDNKAIWEVSSSATAFTLLSFLDADSLR